MMTLKSAVQPHVILTAPNHLQWFKRLGTPHDQTVELMMAFRWLGRLKQQVQMHKYLCVYIH